MGTDTIMTHMEKMEEIYGELEQTMALRDASLKQFTAAFKRYQREEITYEEYQKQMDALFGGQGKQSWVVAQNTYLRSLLSRMDFFNRQIFYRVYAETVQPHMGTSQALFARPVDTKKKSTEVHERREVAPKKEETPSNTPKKVPMTAKPVERIKEVDGFESLFEELETS